MRSGLPYLAMVVGQVAQVGLTLAGKKAIATGMHTFSYVFYSNALSSLILLPTSFLIHRSPDRPALTLSVAGGFLVIGILGFLVQVVGYVGLTYAPATVATAILNLIPGFTFVLGIIFGVERLARGGLGMWAKITGTAVSIVGAIVVTFYTGPAIIMPHLSSKHLLLGESSDWILGGVLMLIDSVFAALFIIAQVHLKTCKHWHKNPLLLPTPKKLPKLETNPEESAPYAGNLTCSFVEIFLRFHQQPPLAFVVLLSSHLVKMGSIDDITL